MSLIPAILLSSSGLIFLLGFLIGLFCNVPMDRRHAGDIGGIALMLGGTSAVAALNTVGVTQLFWASLLVAMMMLCGLGIAISSKSNQA